MGISKEFEFSQTRFGATTFEGGKHAHKRLKKEAGSKGKETPVLQIPCSFLAFGMKCKELYCGSTEFEELESLFL